MGSWSHKQEKKNKKKFRQFKVKKEFYWCTLFHFIFENEIIHILMYVTETRQHCLEQESAKYGNATKKGRTSNKIHSNTWITVKCFTQFFENTSLSNFPLILGELIAITCL